MLNNITIILIETSHSGNIGAAARAMKNMGLSQLRLVKPKNFPAAEAKARAAGAEDILAQAQVFADFATALHDCSLVLGTSARLRTVEWPQVNIRDNASQIVTHAQQQRVAIVFGRESSGLTNEELQQCHYQILIPANTEYSSLNLAAAVQVICYELRVASQQPNQHKEKTIAEPLATAAQAENFYHHLQELAAEIGYLDPTAPGQLMARLRRLFNRSHLTKVEINILRGFISAIQHRLKAYEK